MPDSRLTAPASYGAQPQTITWQQVHTASQALRAAFPEVDVTVELPSWMKTRCLAHAQAFTTKPIQASPPKESVSPLNMAMLELAYLLGWITKLVLVHGAANQLLDIEASQGESVSQLQRLRVELQREQDHLNPSDRKAKHQSTISDSGAGNCAEHCLITLGILASTGLTLDTTLYQTNNDHAFIVIETEDPASLGGRCSVVIDSWAVMPIPHLIKHNLYFSAETSLDLRKLANHQARNQPPPSILDLLAPTITKRPMIIAHIANTLGVKSPQQWRQRYYHEPADSKSKLPGNEPIKDRRFFDMASALLHPQPQAGDNSKLTGQAFDSATAQSLSIRDTLLCTLRPFQLYSCEPALETVTMTFDPALIPRFYLDRLNAAAHFEETHPDTHQALIAHLKSPPY